MVINIIIGIFFEEEEELQSFMNVAMNEFTSTLLSQTYIA